MILLNRLKKSLDDKIKTIKREVSTVVATVNPEIEKVFPNIFTKTAMAIIKAYPTAMDIQKATPAKLTKIFRHIKGNNFSLEKAKYLIDNQLDEDSSNIENTKYIPGVADKTIAAILGECGDLRRFKSSKAFIGFLGLYPTLYQSGKLLSTGKLAKRGIPIAKHALYLSAVSAVRHNSELNKLYRDKRSSGKSTKEAFIIIAKKLASIIYSLFKYNQAYNPSRVLIQYKR